MDFAPNPDHELIVEAVAARSAPFDDEYWSHCDEAHEFPWDFYKAMADDGWVGHAVPRRVRRRRRRASPRRRS